MKRRLAGLAAVALVVAVPVLAQDGAGQRDPRTDPNRFAKVLKWKGRMTVTASGSRSGEIDGAKLTADWKNSWTAEFTLERTDANPDVNVIADGALDFTSVKVSEHFTRVDPPDDEGKRRVTKNTLVSTDQKSQQEGNLNVTFDLEAKKVVLHFNSPLVAGTTEVAVTGEEPVNSPCPCLGAAPLAGEDVKDPAPKLPLPRAGLRVSGGGRFPFRNAMLAGNLPAFATRPPDATVAFRMWPADEDEIDLVITPARYADWTPEGKESEDDVGNSIDVNVHLSWPKDPTKAVKARRLELEIVKSSNQTGTCINAPRKGKATPDFLFPKTPPPVIETDTDRTKAWTRDGEYDSMNFPVESHDWGGWCSISAKAILPDGSEIVGHLDGDESLVEVPLPKDDDRNRIADAWLPGRDKSAESDDDEVPSGTKGGAGDGVSLYEEYRGFYVLDENGARKHVRLDPTVKEIFYLDVDRTHAFSARAWKQATNGSVAYEVDGEGVAGGHPGPDMKRKRDDRRVTVNSGHGSLKPGKTARFIHSSSDPGIYIPKGGTGAGGPTDVSVLGSKEEAPDGETYLFMYPQHIANKYRGDFIDYSLARAAKDPGCDSGQQFAKVGYDHKKVLALWEIAQRKPELVKAFEKRAIALVLTHEMGHAHGIEGHRPTPNDNEAPEYGHITCPMCYWTGDDNRLSTAVELQQLAPNAICYWAMRFCKAGDPPPPQARSATEKRNFDCFGQLRLK